MDMKTFGKFKSLSMLICLILCVAQEIQAQTYDPMRNIDDYPGLELGELWYSGSTHDINRTNTISPIDDTLSGEVRIPGLVTLRGHSYPASWPYCDIETATGFNKCKGITSVIFEYQTVTYEFGTVETNIADMEEDSAFYALPQLTYAKITEVTPYSFADCPKLSRVALFNRTGMVVNTKGFANCHSLESIVGNYTYISASDSAFINCTSLNIDFDKSTINSCKKSAFENCTSLTGCARITDRTIGEKAFYGCKSLNGIALDTNVEEIENSAFENCTSLTDAVIDVSIIGQRAFAGCTSLHSITLGSRTEEVGDYAFAECSAIADVYCMSLEPPVANNNFMTDYTATLHIPTGTGEKYRIAPGWRNFTNIVEDIDPTVGVAGVTQSNISIEAIGTKIIISGNDDNDSISVYDIAGRQVYRGHDNEINLPGSGIYIVNINKMTQKVIIK